MMPIMNGGQLMQGVLPKIIRGKPGFIFMTGTPHLITERNGFRVLKKPFSLNDLVLSINDELTIQRFQ
jgi:hypothetical protein